MLNSASGLTKNASLASWLAWQESYHPKEIDLGLERVNSVYCALNKTPTNHSIFTISVAGTNGKGSCVAMLESILVKAGYRVGVYSTPHLLQYNERVRLNGRPVADEKLVASFERIDTARATSSDTQTSISLSYFEFGTLAALDIFKLEEVDIQILEVGLGGRLDAVNIVDADAVLICSIDIDHVDWLGDNRELIGAEKAGVFRPNQVAVCADKNPPNSLRDIASSLQTTVLFAGDHYSVVAGQNQWELVLNNSNYAGSYPMPKLEGEHQIQNAAAVVCLLAQLSTLKRLTKGAIEQGLTTVNLPGRVQLIEGHPNILLDVAHNPEAARALAYYLSNKSKSGSIHAVFSILSDKDLTGVLAPLLPLIKDWYVAPLESARAQSAAKIAGAITDKTASRCFTFESIDEALDCSRADSNKNDLIVCFGSFLVVEACLGAL